MGTAGLAGTTSVSAGELLLGSDNPGSLLPDSWLELCSCVIKGSEVEDSGSLAGSPGSDWEVTGPNLHGPIDYDISIV